MASEAGAKGVVTQHEGVGDPFTYRKRAGRFSASEWAVQIVLSRARRAARCAPPLLPFYLGDTPLPARAASEPLAQHGAMFAGTSKKGCARSMLGACSIPRFLSYAASPVLSNSAAGQLQVSLRADQATCHLAAIPPRPRTWSHAGMRLA